MWENERRCTRARDSIQVFPIFGHILTSPRSGGSGSEQMDKFVVISAWIFVFIHLSFFALWKRRRSAKRYCVRSPLEWRERVGEGGDFKVRSLFVSKTPKATSFWGVKWRRAKWWHFPYIFPLRTTNTGYILEPKRKKRDHRWSSLCIRTCVCPVGMRGASARWPAESNKMFICGSQPTPWSPLSTPTEKDGERESRVISAESNLASNKLT